MNTKLLLASLIGVGSIGGAVAGGYYLSKEEKTQKTESNKQSNTISETAKTNQDSSPAEDTQTSLSSPQPAQALSPATPPKGPSESVEQRVEDRTSGPGGLGA